MPSQIRPNRLEVSDRFPMLGFTIRTEGEGKRYEVAVASDPALFQPDARSKRTRSNFYSSRAAGLQPVERGEAVYVVPPEVLARFAGQEKLYYALATYPNGKAAGAEIPVTPSQGMPYINLKGLSGRSLRRVRILPSRQRSAASYSNGAGSEFEWAGDAATPGTQPATPSNGAAKAVAPPVAGTAAPQPASPDAVQAAALVYDDGFGALPAPSRTAPPQKRRARAFGDDIPLDPGTGGMSVDASVLQVGDIILSTTDAAVSGLIRFGSGSQVSHAMLYVGQGQQVIEAVGSGVRFVPLDQAIGPATLAVAFRAPNLTDDQRQQIADAAAAYIGQPYNRIGIVRQAAFQIDSAVCRLLPDELQERCRTFVGGIDLGTSRGGEFFCSELVLAAYEAAGAPLTTTPPNWNTPEDLAELAMRAGALAYVGHLKAPPLVRNRSLREVLGLGLGADADQDLMTQAQRLGVADIVQQLIAQGASRAELRRLLDAFTPCQSGPAPRAVGTSLAVATPISTEQARSVRLPAARAASGAEQLAIEAALNVFAGPLAPLVTALRAVARSNRVSIGIGPAAAAGFGLGLGAGAGVIFAADGGIGIYGQLDIRLGLIDSASLGMQVTIVRGGIEAFNEVGFAVGGAFVEGVEVTVQVLFNTSLEFRGVSLEVGAGFAPEPFEIFLAIEGVVSRQIAAPAGQSLGAAAVPARKRGAPLARPMAALPIPVDQARRISPPRARQLGSAERVALDAILAVIPPPISSAIALVRGIADAGGYSVAIGPSASVNFLLGLGGGFAVIFGPNGAIGVMGSIEIRAGLLDSLAAGIRIAVVRGNIESFNEVTLAVGGAFIEGIDVTIEVLFTTNLTFRGVSFELGVGIAAEPLEVFAAIEFSASQQLAAGESLAYAASAGGGKRRREPARWSHARAATALDAPAGARPVQYPQARQASVAERAIVEGLLIVTGPLGIWINSLRSLADSSGLSIALGPVVSGGVGEGVSASFGVIFAPGSRVGVYGSISSIEGLVSGVSAGGKVTVVRGGIESFNEIGSAIGAKVEVEGVEVGVEALYAADESFRGIAVELGVGEGSPVQIYRAVEAGVARQVGAGQALAAAAAAGAGAATVKRANGGLYLPPPPAPVYRARSLDAGVAEAAIAIAGIAIEHVINNETSITWDLEQWRGIKHPNDTAPAPAAPFQDAPPIMLNQWPVVEAVDGDQISAWFQVDWQFNGRSLGNIRIRNTGTNNALLRRLRVDARIMDDNVVYPRDNPTYAALRITLTYRFSRAVGADSIATTELHLYGDGHIDANGHWDQE